MISPEPEPREFKPGELYRDYYSGRSGYFVVLRIEKNEVYVWWLNTPHWSMSAWTSFHSESDLARSVTKLSK